MTNRADRFTVVLDANVIAGALTRNILLSLAEGGFYRPRWSTEILDEFERYFIKRYDDSDGALRQRSNMEKAFPEALVTDYEQLVDALSLPDPDDRHVLAAAIQTGAALIVTENLKDFPSASLTKFEIEAIGLDHFLADILDLAGIEAIAALRRMRERFNAPEINADVLLSKIEQLKLLETAGVLYAYRELL